MASGHSVPLNEQVEWTQQTKMSSAFQCLRKQKSQNERGCSLAPIFTRDLHICQWNSSISLTRQKSNLCRIIENSEIFQNEWTQRLHFSRLQTKLIIELMWGWFTYRTSSKWNFEKKRKPKASEILTPNKTDVKGGAKYWKNLELNLKFLKSGEMRLKQRERWGKRLNGARGPPRCGRDPETYNNSWRFFAFSASTRKIIKKCCSSFF